MGCRAFPRGRPLLIRSAMRLLKHTNLRHDFLPWKNHLDILAAADLALKNLRAEFRDPGERNCRLALRDVADQIADLDPDLLLQVMRTAFQKLERDALHHVRVKISDL